MALTRQHLAEVAKKEVSEERIKNILLEQPEGGIPPEELMGMVQQALEMVGGAQPAIETISGAMESLQQVPAAQEILGQLMQHFQQQQAQQAQAAEQEQKQSTEQSRMQTQAALEESLLHNIKNILEDSLHVENTMLQEQDLEVFETMAHLVVDKQTNYEHIFTRIRAVEGVTVVSIETAAQEIGPTLDRLYINIKYVKGARPSKYFLSLLNRALLRISGIKSVRFVSTRKLQNV
jgi:(p)ppGpp synthase/HD superfamily hydrolase